VTILRTGDWTRARDLIAKLPQEGARAFRGAVLQEAHQLRKQIVEGLNTQAPGGQPLKPLDDLTRAARRLRRFTGTKALIRRGDLRNGIAVIETGRAIFVGIPRSAVSQDGRSLLDIATIQENGTDPIIIPITPRMRRFLAVLYREAGRDLPTGGGGGRGVVVVQVPPRPFLRPAFDRFRAGLERRILERTARGLRARGAR
jgi:hypothetical protein